MTDVQTITDEEAMAILVEQVLDEWKQLNIEANEKRSEFVAMLLATDGKPGEVTDVFSDAELRAVAKGLGMDIPADVDRVTVARRIAVHLDVRDLAEASARAHISAFEGFLPARNQAEGMRYAAWARYGSRFIVPGPFAQRYDYRFLIPDEEVADFPSDAAEIPDEDTPFERPDGALDQERIVLVEHPKTGRLALIHTAKGDPFPGFVANDGRWVPSGRKWEFVGVRVVQDVDEAQVIVRNIRAAWKNADEVDAEPFPGEDDVPVRDSGERTLTKAEVDAGAVLPTGPLARGPVEVPMGDTVEMLAAADDADDDDEELSNLSRYFAGSPEDPELA